MISSAMRLATYLKKIAIVLIAMALPANVLGPAALYIPLVLGTLLLAGSFSTDMVMRLKENLPTNKLAALAALALASLGVSSYVGIQPDYALRHWVTLVVVAALGYLLFLALTLLSQQDRLLLKRVFIISLWVSFGIALVIMFFEPLFIAWGWYTGEDEWTQTHLRLFSSVLAVILPFAWQGWLYDDKIEAFQLTWQNLTLCAFSVVMVLLCAGRSGWTGVAISAPMMGFMLWRYHGLKLDFAALACTAVGTFLAGGLGYWLVYGATSIQERVGIIVPDRGLGGGRLDIWHLAWQHMFDSPVWGLGVNTFRFLPGADYHPHNFVLQIGLEGGFMGFLLCMVLLGTFLTKVYAYGKKSSVSAAAFAAILGFCMCALTNKSIFNPEWLIYFVVVTAMGLAWRKYREDLSM